MERPEGPTEEATTVIEQSSNGHDGLAEINTTGLLPAEACLPCARKLLDHRQTRHAVRALSADGDHPTHQLLPANFRFRELYRYGGATGQLSSIGLTRPEKTRRSFGGRLALQIVRNVSYDPEYGFELPCKQILQGCSIRAKPSNPNLRMLRRAKQDVT